MTTPRRLVVQRMANQCSEDLPEAQRTAIRRDVWAIKRKVKAESTKARAMARRAGLGVPA
jgi:uncharacterized membrane protein